MKTETQSNEAFLRPQVAIANAAALRTFQTSMTNQQLAEPGLGVLEQTSSLGSFQQFVGLKIATGTVHPALFHASDFSGFVLAPQRARDGVPHWMGAFDARMAELDETAVEDEIEPSPASKADAIAFTKRLTGTRKPSVGLVGNGNYALRWISRHGERVSLQFRGEGDVQYLFFKADDDRMEHMMGTKRVANIVKFIETCGLWHVLAAV